MSNPLKRVLLGAGFAGVALLSLSAVAWSGSHGGMERDPGRMLAHMADRLDLSDAQQEQAEQIISGAVEQGQQYREEMSSLREQLRAMQGNFDPDTARSLSQQIGTLTGEVVYLMASTHARIYDMLTPEQREQMEALREHWEERRDKWHHRLGSHDTGD